ncbi:NuA4-domain-containing protein [Aspergillus heteromorphus CBS 117.55]|uniref:Chromatin modification-related protein EAF6 n=1 Tax=Aspergillus heteromorphus CBS 117.55 TaxID=1448321 RepID=A0A317X775_9EURO|nr:NuA4-domain-containing protein [Aspergillus heteromorphus CBS 117.55]PWY92728.1 NuA4-domain-containing protein [Aspergillus heteromorphus CBS 117.55]
MAEPAPPTPSAAAARAGTPSATPNTTTNGSNSLTISTTNNNSSNSNGTTTLPNPPTAESAASRGLPYYEKLRRELRDTLQKKRLMDKSMAQLEDQIFRFEQSYLEETTAGNIIKGFDNYIKGSSSGAGLGAGGLALSTGVGGGATRRKAPVTDVDRVFSRSSASFMRDSPAPSSAQTTPSHAATPNSTYNGSTGKPGNGEASSAANSVKGQPSKNKKKASVSGGSNKDKGGDDDGTDGDKPPTKRLKITYGRD